MPSRPMAPAVGAAEDPFAQEAPNDGMDENEREIARIL